CTDVDEQDGDEVLASGFFRGGRVAGGDRFLLAAGQGEVGHGGGEQTGRGAEGEVPHTTAPQSGCREVRWKPAQHQDEHDQTDRFDQELGEGDVGCGLEVEQGCTAVTAD